MQINSKYIFFKHINTSITGYGFDPSEKYACQNGFIFAKIRGENQKSLKPPPRNSFTPPKIHSKYMLNGHTHRSSIIYLPWVSMGIIHKATRSRLHEVFPLLLGIFQVRLQSASWVFLTPNQVTRTWNGEVDTFGIVKLFQWNLPGLGWILMNQNESDPLEEVENNITCCKSKLHLFWSPFFTSYFHRSTRKPKLSGTGVFVTFHINHLRFLGLPSTAVAWHSVFRRQGV